MILTAFRLARDPHTESQSFGYQRPFWPNEARIDGRFTPKLGCPIELDVRLVTSMVKIVEYYMREAGPVVVERLAWAFDRQLYPYRAKYIRPSTKGYGEASILFLPNIGAIHRRLSNTDALFSSPLQYYLNTMTFDPYQNIESRNVINDIYNEHRNAIDGLAEQEVDWESIRHLLDLMDHEYPASIEKNFRDYFVPKLPILEPVSVRSWCRPLSMCDVRATPTSSPFDITPVAEIPITHPEITLYSPRECHRIGETFEEISHQFTDVKLEYILSDRQIKDCKIHHLVSRYCDVANPEIVMHLCTHIALDVIVIAQTRYPTTRWPGTISVTLQMTYGDEVLIELRTVDSNQCLCSMHLDLALLALCASSVIAQVSGL